MTQSAPPHRRRATPWWPEGESWPPRGAQEVAAWRQVRRRFLFRMALPAAFLFIFIIAGVALFFWLAANFTGFGHGRGPFGGPPFGGPRPGFFVLLLLVAGGIVAARALRGAARPLGDVVEAAGRVADGDYGVRVMERGPGEVRALARSFNTMITRLQANERQRRQLLAEVTHELRTPLTVIQGNLEGLLDGVYPRDDAHLGPILDETRILSRLIDDLRTLALAEAGELRLERESTDLGALVADIVASFRAQADEARIRVEARVDPGLPSVEVDPARIRQVVENLIANALRYTDAGGTVRVTCRIEEATGRARVIIEVADSGRGIEPEDLPHIFERFYRSRDSRGSGLGLAIARNLVAAHGGEITAESEPGRGTAIRFTLPVGPPAHFE